MNKKLEICVHSGRELRGREVPVIKSHALIILVLVSGSIATLSPFSLLARNKIDAHASMVAADKVEQSATSSHTETFPSYFCN